ncbi:large conductance mechanosensitive channel protein MscL [Rothia koreensis]|uniref:large conductance mechanosensitive channel protein MscL n=1 Tax=Rothia koreensis TaxID=592378 RepID=UPI003FCED4C2
MLKGFKDFIMRGNVIDLAVGVIIGGAFSTVVNALVESVIMPAISMLVGSPKFDDFLVFGQIKIGVFLTALVNFLLVAAALYFCIVMPINAMNARRARKLGLEEEDETEPEVALLTEIRDALISNKNVTGASSYVDPEANKN